VDKVPLPGTQRQHPTGTLIGTQKPDERFSVTVHLRPRSGKGERFPRRFQHKILTHKEFAALHGAYPEDIRRIEAFAQENNLAVEGVYPEKRTVKLSGQIADFSKAFQVVLNVYEIEGRQFRAHVGPIHLPPDLVPVVQGLQGLDTRSIFRPAQVSGVEINSIQDVISACNFPTGLDGTGQTIGIICFDGGFQQSDLDSFFGQTVPTIISVPTNGNIPGHFDNEVTFDIEMVGTIAPAATIVAYFIPVGNFINGVHDAVHDNVNLPSVVSISFAGAESAANDNDKLQLEQIFQDAADLGITVLAATGDRGSNSSIGTAEVNLPASCPHVTACGGTVATIVGGVIQSEVVWNNPPEASGGGVSDFFSVPPYQAAAGIFPISLTNIPVFPPIHFGRGIPDVSGHADDYSSFFFQGATTFFSGTSAVTPLWAALIALINQLKGSRQGFLNPVIYGRLGSTLRTPLNDILTGDNGAYSAGPGWDLCTGWGSPNGGVIADLLGPPTIESVDPSIGPVGGGRTITIRGNRFIGAKNVLFGAANAPSFNVDNDQQISALLPGVTTDDTVHVQVITEQGSSATTPNDLFNYFFPIPVVSSVFPSSGSAAGGISISIAGLFFTGTTSVTFLGPSINVTVSVHETNDGLIELNTSNTITGGIVDVLVNTPGGSSALTSLDQFQFLAAPAGSFVVLVDPTATAAQFAELQDTVTSAGGTVEQATPPIMFSATGPTTVQQALLTSATVLGLFPSDVATAITALLSDGADPAAIATLLSGLVPTAPPADVLPGDDVAFGDDLTGEDDDFSPVVDRPSSSET